MSGEWNPKGSLSPSLRGLSVSVTQQPSTRVTVNHVSGWDREKQAKGCFRKSCTRLCMCVCVCIHAYMCTCVSAYVCAVCTSVSVCAPCTVYIHVPIFIQVHSCIYIPLGMCMCVHVCTCMPTQYVQHTSPDLALCSQMCLVTEG